MRRARERRSSRRARKFSLPSLPCLLVNRGCPHSTAARPRCHPRPATKTLRATTEPAQRDFRCRRPARERTLSRMILAPSVRDVILRDGGTLRLRAPLAEDVGLLLDFFGRLSSDSVYRRFHGFPNL